MNSNNRNFEKVVKKKLPNFFSSPSSSDKPASNALEMFNELSVSREIFSSSFFLSILFSFNSFNIELTFKKISTIIFSFE